MALTVLSSAVAGVVTLLVGYVIIKLFQFYRFLKRMNEGSAQFPNMSRHWFWGVLIEIKSAEDILTKCAEFTKIHKKYFVMWFMFFRPILTVVHPDSAKVILKTTEPKTAAGGGYGLLEPWLGNGLLLSSGKIWERNRRLLTPAFHFDILKPYIKVYHDAAGIFLEKISDLSQESKQSIDICPHVTLMTLDIMLKCAFSLQENIQREGKELGPLACPGFERAKNRYVAAVGRLSKLIMYRGLRPYLYPDIIFNLTANGKEFNKHCDYLHQYSDDVIRKRRIALEEDPDILKKRYLDFLDILLTAKDADGNGMTDLEIRYEVDTFLFEGHDTTASTLNSAILALAKYPQEQEKVFLEVEEVLQGKEHLAWDDLPKLTNLHLFIKEVMRMYSPVFTVSRQVTKPLMFDGKELPAGFAVDINIHAMNHSPHIWDEPEEFRPSRFSTEEYSKRDPYCFVPFSAGPRNCIGQNFAINEEKIVIGRLVQAFKITLDSSHKVEFVPELVMRAKTGIKVYFESRS